MARQVKYEAGPLKSPDNILRLIDHCIYRAKKSKNKKEVEWSLVSLAVLMVLLAGGTTLRRGVAKKIASSYKELPNQLKERGHIDVARRISKELSALRLRDK